MIRGIEVLALLASILPLTRVLGDDSRGLGWQQESLYAPTERNEVPLFSMDVVPSADADYSLPPPTEVIFPDDTVSQSHGSTIVEDTIIGETAIYDGVGDAWGTSVPLYEQFGSHDLFQMSPETGPIATRFGGWNVQTQGDTTKVGEYQRLSSSPFGDIDGLFTDRLKTVDLHASYFNDVGRQLGLRYIGPRISTRLDYQKFLHRLDHNPLTGFTDYDQQPSDPLPPPPRNFRVMKEDVNVGEDYAIRVQELNADFKGKITERVKWRLNVWGMRKKGDRQVNAMAHCFRASNATDSNGNPVTGVSCHVLSQGQHIDWLTVQVEPSLEAKFGPATVEYSRTMRSFSQDDQITTRPYDNFGFSGDLPYAVVPENYTGIDRLKMGLNLPDYRSVYAQAYNGNTRNRDRDTNRRFHGFDLRRRLRRGQARFGVYQKKASDCKIRYDKTCGRGNLGELKATLETLHGRQMRCHHAEDPLSLHRQFVS